MKKLINRVNNIVPEMVNGIVKSSNHKLKKVKNYNVVIRNRINNQKVALISGGGSGHEPAHAGYVGKGMLTAAVCGEVFTSPTPDMILSAIEACNSKKGTLLIIKNYTGDVMNFQLAEQMAQAKGYQVASVIVNDDIALAKSTASTGRRGICGTIFVHKIAGAAAEAGMSLDEVKNIAQKVIQNTATIGLGLDACIVPAVGKKGFELNDNELEMGLGIHGEPGVAREPMRPVKQLVMEMIDKIQNELNFANSRVGVIINGMGATPLMELYVAANNANRYIKKLGGKIAFFKTGNYMTALDMPGMSISICKLDEQTEKLLKAKAQTLAWA